MSSSAPAHTAAIEARQKRAQIIQASNNAGVRSKQVEDFRTTTGTAEERQQDLNALLKEGYGYYISRPLIVGVGSEQRDAGRYF